MYDVFLFVMVTVIFLVGIVFFISLAWITSKTKNLAKMERCDVEQSTTGDGLLLNSNLCTDNDNVHYIIGDVFVKGKILNDRFDGEIGRVTVKNGRS